MEDYQNVLNEVVERVYRLFAPPPVMTLSQWADKYAQLSPESAAEPGKWTSIPYQREIMDAFTDPEIERITVMKSARVGYTKILNNVIGYYAHLDPCNILMVQPTVEDAQGYSKDEIAPMVRDTPVLQDVISDPRAKDGRNTILRKSYPGGTLYLVGANSPRGFRRISARIVLFDEIDGYPASAGTEGDQLKLGIKRSEYFWNRKIGMGSTPTIKGESKIEREYELSDKRELWVPCPHCGEFQTLKWSGIQWPDDQPELAFYVCEHHGCLIDHSLKTDMVDAGEWRAGAVSKGHAGFFIWSGYSYSPNAAWGILAREWLDCQDDTEALQTFINTTLGQTWEEKSVKVEWEVLQKRAEDYTAPAGAGLVLTAGVDVQQNRLEVGIESWSIGEENWQVEYLYLFGDTDQPEVWADLTKALARTFRNEAGAVLPISATCIDSGYRTDFVYAYVKKHSSKRVYATKGIPGAGLPIVDKATKKRTGRDPRPVRRFNLGVDGAKSVIYHRLKTAEPGPRYRHFSNALEQEYYEGLTAEKIVTKKRRGFEYREWVLTRPRNEPLDIAVLNYAALKILNPVLEVITGGGSEPEQPKTPGGGAGRFSRRSGGGFKRR